MMKPMMPPTAKEGEKWVSRLNLELIGEEQW